MLVSYIVTKSIAKVLQNLAHVPVVELLPVYVISVVRLVQLRQRRFDAQGLLAGPSATTVCPKDRR